MIQTTDILSCQAHEVLRRRNIMKCISQNTFYTKEHNNVDLQLAIDEREAEIGNSGRLARLITL